MKKIFIGSSTEGLSIAKKIESELKSKCSDRIKCHLWNDGSVFDLNQGTLKELLDISMHVDIAVFIASSDDRYIKRRRRGKAMRDNVLFESGMFMSVLGAENTYILFDKNITNLPSDFDGVTRCLYNKRNLDAKIDDIVKKIESRLGSTSIKLLPSAVLAQGYFDSYITPLSSKLMNCYEDKYSLDIILPVNECNLGTLISTHIAKFPLKDNDHFKDGKRPTAYQYSYGEANFWDIPTTLSALFSLINTVFATRILGNNTEINDIVTHEIRNFKHALEILIHRNGLSKNINISSFNP